MVCHLSWFKYHLAVLMGGEVKSTFRRMTSKTYIWHFWTCPLLKTLRQKRSFSLEIRSTRQHALKIGQQLTATKCYKHEIFSHQFQFQVSMSTSRMSSDSHPKFPLLCLSLVIQIEKEIVSPTHFNENVDSLAWRDVGILGIRNLGTALVNCDLWGSFNLLLPPSSHITIGLITGEMGCSVRRARPVTT